MPFESWGKTPKSESVEKNFNWRFYEFPEFSTHKVLPVGLGRSYGDCCLNDGNTIIHMSKLNRLMGFDSINGVLTCEAGVSLDDLLKFTVPRGWFLPVTPGTKFITIGGAIANDIHGKNHHVSGTFGRFVNKFELLRSDGTRKICSPTHNKELFEATIGGIGLTGIITWAEFRLVKIKSGMIDMESVKFTDIDEFLQVSKELSPKYEYTVSWLDCLGTGGSIGRGIFMAGNFADYGDLKIHKPPILNVPFNFPEFALNNLSMSIFNTLYYNKQLEKSIKINQHYDPFFYPLDIVNNWNRIYGKRGFFQFQSVVPIDALKELVTIVVKSGKGSFLAVLKEFGDIKSPGLMSFPQEGATLALDFPNRGDVTNNLLKRLDDFTREVKGRIYFAKDNYMSRESFSQYYPNIEEFVKYIDPAISSNLWRRLHT